MNKEPSAVDLRWTERYRAIPYMLDGVDDAGVDCWGLVRMVAVIECGLDLPQLSATSAGLRGQVNAFDLAKAGAPEVGDGEKLPLHAIVLMGPRPESNIATHAGIYVGAGYVMHAGSAFGVRVDHWGNLVELHLHVVSVHDIHAAAAWMAARA